METVFPEGAGYAGFFVLGFRKDPDDPADPPRTQRIGTVILKRTYAIDPAFDPALGSLTPSKEPLPAFEQDVAENLVLNGNMEASQKAFGEGDREDLPGAWQADGGADLLLAGGEGLEGAGDTGLRVSGAADSRVVQTIALDEPLGGRTFSLSLHAKADANTDVKNVQLEADGAVICSLDRALTTSYARFTATGTWAESVTAKEMQVVLRMATEGTRTVYYDDVEVLERDYTTKVDVAALRYESDLTPFKPEGDVIVLGFADQAGDHRVYVNGDAWLERAVTVNGAGLDTSLFGWEPRAADPRKGEAAFPEDESEYPLPGLLPDDFNNRFYNGYHRQAFEDGDLSELPYFSPGDEVLIQRHGPSNDYGFTLGSESVTAAVYTYRGYGADEARFWRGHDVTMHLDTLVIEPEVDRCYAVWRGGWEFDAYTEDVYRRLVVEVADV